METKVLPIQQIEGHLEPAKTKTGRISKTKKNWVETVVSETQECAKFHVAGYGKELDVWVPVSHMNDERFRTSCCYREDGTMVNGIWRHGQYGNIIHEEPLLIDWKTGRLISMADYHDGNIRNSKKFLIGING